MKLLSTILYSFFVFFYTQKIFAAACCGGSIAAAGVISGDNKAQLTTSLSRSEVVADVYADEYWRKRETPENSETLRIEGAFLLSDRWQAGLNVPVTKRTKLSQSSSGLGDTTSHIGYEYLPEWDYSLWRPKGIGFLQLTLPTGKSVYESNDSLGLDSRGRGFWALGIGTLLLKSYKKWDSFINLEAHKSFSKTISNQQFEGTLVPGWGGSAGPGLGYNWTNWRLGGNILWIYEDAIELRSATSVSKTEPQKYASSTLSLSHLFLVNWTMSISYTDQTLFGSPSNTSLSRSFALQLQKRWDR